jgi:hypothetical protein
VAKQKRRVPSKKTRVSDFYKLGLKQPSLEFVDVTLEKDAKIFVDPRAFAALGSKWGDECVSLIRGFFSQVLAAIRDEDEERARQLLSGLHEPNETRLGMSKDRVAGRGVGDHLADEIYLSLAQSEAIEYGLIEKLEDTALLVEGIGVDRVSDISTNIVREKLIEFTLEMAEKYGLDLIDGLETGPVWDPAEGKWRDELQSLPAPAHKPLILVPRTIARWKLDYDPGEYYRHHVIPFLQNRELEKRRSPIVNVIKTGRRKGERAVTKKATDAYYRDRLEGGEKKVSVDVTRDNLHVFQQYRESRERRFRGILSFAELNKRIGTPEPDWDSLLSNVTELKPGAKAAHEYHRAVEALLTPLFSPDLVDPKREVEIVQGTQRIDIRYRKMAQSGFFDWFSRDIAKIPWVAFECKNYKEDPKNPEVNQLASRLNAQRGLLGFLVCRQIKDRKRFRDRCRGYLNPDGKYLLGLDDADLKKLVEARKRGNREEFSTMLSDLVEQLIE